MDAAGFEPATLACEATNALASDSPARGLFKRNPRSALNDGIGPYEAWHA
jgi:hypothetical protein